MIKRIFTFFAVFMCCAAFALDENANDAPSAFRTVMTRDQISDAAITTMEELLESMGLNTIFFSPKSSAFSRASTSRNTVFVIDGVRQNSIDSSEFDISTFDVSLIEKIEFQHGGFTDGLISTGGNIVTITTMSEYAKKFNLTVGANSYTNAFSGYNANMSANIGLQNASINMMAYSNMDTNQFEYADRDSPFEIDFSKSTLSGMSFFNVGGEFLFNAPMKKGSLFAVDRINFRSQKMKSSIIEENELEQMFNEDKTVGNNFLVNFNANLAKNIFLSAILSDTHCNSDISLVSVSDLETHFQNTPFAQVEAKFAFPVCDLKVGANYAGSYNSGISMFLHDIRAGISLNIHPLDCLKIIVPFTIYYTNKKFNWTPKIQVAYLWNAGFAAVSAYKFYNPTSFSETSWNGRIQGETGYTTELSIGLTKSVPLNFLLYCTYYKDLVQDVWEEDLSGTTKISSRNYNNSTSAPVISRDEFNDLLKGRELALGLSLGGDFPVTDNFSLRLGYDFTFNSICDEKLSLIGEGMTDYIPLHNFIFGFNAKVKNLQLNFFGHYISSHLESTFNHAGDEIDITPTTFSPCFLADVSLRYRIRDFDIYAKIQNILSSNYWISSYQPGKAMTISLGCNYAFR